MKIDKKTILEAKETLDATNELITSYLTKLQNEEAKIICIDPDIESGAYNCFHIRPIPIFHELQTYDPYIKLPIKYEITDYTDYGIIIIFNGRKFIVPYTFSQTDFDKFWNELFAKSKADIERCKKAKKEAKKEAKQRKNEEERIATKHTWGDYSYYWKQCPNCNGSGTVTVGTGEWEDDPYSYSDSPREREITREEKCPKCNGTQGLVVVSEQTGDFTQTKESPCSRSSFVTYEHDLMKLLVVSCR